MKRFLLGACVFFVTVPSVFAAEPISRRDGFLLIWNSIVRPATDTRESPYTDVPEGSPGFKEITFAKRRGLLPDEETFHPDAPLELKDALLWMFRTRNIEAVDPDTGDGMSDIVEEDDLPFLLEKYPLITLRAGVMLTEEDLMNLMRNLDAKLVAEDHEVSLYSEKFHGKGTAFGETFDMNALTAAHRTFPQNTLVKVTNTDNGKSVVVRINDRGPFVVGRDMDLSLASFLKIAERSKGKIRATFERLGDSTLVNYCDDQRFRRRIGKDVVLNPGIPHRLKLGDSLNLSSESFFVVRSVTYPDGNTVRIESWIGPDETFPFTPSVEGSYTFTLGSKLGRVREMTMDVMNCDA